MLKMSCGSLCTPGNVIMILDAKNIMTNPFGMDTFVDGDKLKIYWFKLFPDRYRAEYENSCSVWDLTPEEIEDCASGFPGIMTPWVVHTDVLREFADSYAERHGEFEIRPVTQFEFFLMGAFIHRKFGRIQNYFSRDTNQFSTFLHRKDWLSGDSHAFVMHYMLTNKFFDLDSANLFIEQIKKEINSYPHPDP